jgi:hypothetical protein
MKLVCLFLLASTVTARYQMSSGLQNILGSVSKRRLDETSPPTDGGEEATTVEGGGAPGQSVNGEWIATQCESLKDICTGSDIDVKDAKVKSFLTSGFDGAETGFAEDTDTESDSSMDPLRKLLEEGEFDYSCETKAEVRFMCDYVCGTKCTTTDINQISKFSGNDAFTGTSSDPISGNDETALNHVCADNQCLSALIDGQIKMMEDFWKCPHPVDEFSTDGNTSDTSAAESPADQIKEQMAGEISFMCTQNEKKEYCMKKFKSDMDESVELDMSTLTCDTPSMKVQSINSTAVY